MTLIDIGVVLVIALLWGISNILYRIEKQFEFFTDKLLKEIRIVKPFAYELTKIADALNEHTPTNRRNT